MNPPLSNSESGDVSLTVENLGGIDYTQLTLDSGVNVLTGRNATNRTSLLSALGSVLGGTTASLKSDTDEGYVTLELNDETYQRKYTRATNEVQVTGNAYSDQEALVDLCVTLFENNPARQAVERGSDLREVIMRPVDTEAIQARIADLKQKKKSVENELEHVREQRAYLPTLEQKRDELSDEIAEVDQQIEELRTEVSKYEADIETAEEASDVVDELNARRQELSSLSDKLEVKQAERDALRDDITDVESELEEIPDDLSDKLSTTVEQLTSVQSRKDELDDTIASLTTIVDFNEDLLNEKTGLPGINAETVDITSGLSPEEEQDVICWTCGSRVERGDISERLDDLRNVIEDKRQTRTDLQERISELQESKRELENAQTRKSTLKQQRNERRDKVEAREQTIEELRTKRKEVEDEIDRLERKAAETEELRETDLLDKYERISDLQYERGQLQQQMSDLIDEIEEIESLPTKEDLESQHAEIQDKLEEERTRITDLETEAIDAFNEHMDELLDILEYENIARVWIEKKRSNGNRSSVNPNTEFDLNIVRETAAGAGYEDHVENLSESEREVIGLVVALAGYLVHDVHEEVPFMLLDSLEAIDAQRIGTLVEYFATHVPYLVIALLPEDAATLDEDYNQITADGLTA